MPSVDKLRLSTSKTDIASTPREASERGLSLALTHSAHSKSGDDELRPSSSFGITITPIGDDDGVELEHFPAAPAPSDSLPGSFASDMLGIISSSAGGSGSGIGDSVDRIDTLASDDAKIASSSSLASPDSYEVKEPAHTGRTDAERRSHSRGRSRGRRRDFTSTESDHSDQESDSSPTPRLSASYSRNSSFRRGGAEQSLHVLKERPSVSRRRRSSYNEDVSKTPYWIKERHKGSHAFLPQMVSDPRTSLKSQPLFPLVSHEAGSGRHRSSTVSSTSSTGTTKRTSAKRSSGRSSGVSSGGRSSGTGDNHGGLAHISIFKEGAGVASVPVVAVPDPDGTVHVDDDHLGLHRITEESGLSGSLDSVSRAASEETSTSKDRSSDAGLIHTVAASSSASTSDHGFTDVEGYTTEYSTSLDDSDDDEEDEDDDEEASQLNFDESDLDYDISDMVMPTISGEVSEDSKHSPFYTTDSNHSLRSVIINDIPADFDPSSHRVSHAIGLGKMQPIMFSVVDSQNEPVAGLPTTKGSLGGMPMLGVDSDGHVTLDLDGSGGEILPSTSHGKPPFSGPRSQPPPSSTESSAKKSISFSSGVTDKHMKDQSIGRAPGSSASSSVRSSSAKSRGRSQKAVSFGIDMANEAFSEESSAKSKDQSRSTHHTRGRSKTSGRSRSKSKVDTSTSKKRGQLSSRISGGSSGDTGGKPSIPRAKSAGPGFDRAKRSHTIHSTVAGSSSQSSVSKSDIEARSQAYDQSAVLKQRHSVISLSALARQSEFGAAGFQSMKSLDSAIAGGSSGSGTGGVSGSAGGVLKRLGRGGSKKSSKKGKALSPHRRGTLKNLAASPSIGIADLGRAQSALLIRPDSRPSSPTDHQSGGTGGGSGKSESKRGLGLFSFARKKSRQSGAEDSPSMGGKTLSVTPGEIVVSDSEAGSGGHSLDYPKKSRKSKSKSSSGSRRTPKSRDRDSYSESMSDIPDMSSLNSSLDGTDSLILPASKPNMAFSFSESSLARTAGGSAPPLGSPTMTTSASSSALSSLSPATAGKIDSSGISGDSSALAKGIPDFTDGSPGLVVMSATPPAGSHVAHHSSPEGTLSSIAKTYGTSKGGAHAHQIEHREIENLLPLVVRMWISQLTKGDDAVKIRPPKSLKFETVAMFADVSGFTKLSEHLSQGGPGGAEKLAFYLNRYLEQLASKARAQGGDVFKFAGDAIIILWPPPLVFPSDDTSLASDTAMASVLAETEDEKRNRAAKLVARAVQCAKDIQVEFNEAEIIPGAISLSVKIGIGYGSTKLMFVGGKYKRLEVLACGKSLSQAFGCESHAVSGDVIISREALSLIHGKYFNGRPLKGFTDEDTPAFKIDFSQRLRNRVKKQALRSSPSVAQEHLRRLVPAAAWQRLLTRFRPWHSEQRTVTVLFINLDLMTSDDDPSKRVPLEDLAVQKLQDAVRLCQKCVYHFKGSLNKFLFDDKGAGVIAVFGLPPVANFDDCIRAVLAALLLEEVMGQFNIRVRIGVTTGRVYCGVVGHSGSSSEYGILGEKVNLAARLMQHAKTSVKKGGLGGQGVVVSDITYNECKHCPNIVWNQLKSTAVKGFSKEFVIWRPYYRQVSGMVSLKRTRIFIGWEKEFRLVSQIFASMSSPFLEEMAEELEDEEEEEEDVDDMSIIAPLSPVSSTSPAIHHQSFPTSLAVSPIGITPVVSDSTDTSTISIGGLRKGDKSIALSLSMDTSSDLLRAHIAKGSERDALELPSLEKTSSMGSSGHGSSAAGRSRSVSPRKSTSRTFHLEAPQSISVPKHTKSQSTMVSLSKSATVRFSIPTMEQTDIPGNVICIEADHLGGATHFAREVLHSVQDYVYVLGSINLPYNNDEYFCWKSILNRLLKENRLLRGNEERFKQTFRRFLRETDGGSLIPYLCLMNELIDSEFELTHEAKKILPLAHQKKIERLIRYKQRSRGVYKGPVHHHTGAGGPTSRVTKGRSKGKKSVRKRGVSRKGDSLFAGSAAAGSGGGPSPSSDHLYRFMPTLHDDSSYKGSLSEAERKDREEEEKVTSPVMSDEDFYGPFGKGLFNARKRRMLQRQTSDGSTAGVRSPATQTMADYGLSPGTIVGPEFYHSDFEDVAQSSETSGSSRGSGKKGHLSGDSRNATSAEIDAFAAAISGASIASMGGGHSRQVSSRIIDFALKSQIKPKQKDKMGEYEVLKQRVKIIVHLLKQASMYTPIVVIIGKHQYMELADFKLSEEIAKQIASADLKNVSILLCGWSMSTLSMSYNITDKERAIRDQYRNIKENYANFVIRLPKWDKFQVRDFIKSEFDVDHISTGIQKFILNKTDGIPGLVQALVRDPQLVFLKHGANLECSRIENCGDLENGYQASDINLPIPFTAQSYYTKMLDSLDQFPLLTLKTASVIAVGQEFLSLTFAYDVLCHVHPLNYSTESNTTHIINQQSSMFDLEMADLTNARFLSELTKALNILEEEQFITKFRINGDSTIRVSDDPDYNGIHTKEMFYVFSSGYLRDVTYTNMLYKQRSLLHKKMEVILKMNPILAREKMIRKSIKRHRLLSVQDGFVRKAGEIEEIKKDIMDEFDGSGAGEKAALHGKETLAVSTALRIPNCVMILYLQNIPQLDDKSRSQCYITLHLGTDKGIQLCKSVGIFDEYISVVINKSMLFSLMNDSSGATLMDYSGVPSMTRSAAAAAAAAGGGGGGSKHHSPEMAIRFWIKPSGGYSRKALTFGVYSLRLHELYEKQLTHEQSQFRALTLTMLDSSMARSTSTAQSTPADRKSTKLFDFAHSSDFFNMFVGYKIPIKLKDKVTKGKKKIGTLSRDTKYYLEVFIKFVSIEDDPRNNDSHKFNLTMMGS